MTNQYKQSGFQSITPSIYDTTVTKITENIYSIYHSDYNSLVVIGDKGVLITDPANSYRAIALQREIARITDLPVTHIFLSHEHYDHVGGTEVFKNAKIIAQEKTLPIFELDVMGQAPKTIHKTFNASYSVIMGQTKVDFYHFGFPSDGTANTIVYLPKEGVVFSADLYENRELGDKQFIDALNSLGVRESLNRLVALKPKYAITTHSVGIEVENLVLAAEFFNDLYNAVFPGLMEASTQGFKAQIKFTAEFPKQIKLEKYKNFKNYNHLYRHTKG